MHAYAGRQFVPFLQWSLVWPGREANSRPTVREADTLPTEPTRHGRIIWRDMIWHYSKATLKSCHWDPYYKLALWQYDWSKTQTNKNNINIRWLQKYTTMRIDDMITIHVWRLTYKSFQTWIQSIFNNQFMIDTVSILSWWYQNIMIIN